MVLEIRQQQDLEQLLERSNSDPILIFKHSTQCPISAQAYDEFMRFADATPGLTSGVVLVIENRTLSNTIASWLGIRHESPQAIVVRNGKAEWNASHWKLTVDALADAVGRSVRL